MLHKKRYMLHDLQACYLSKGVCDKMHRRISPIYIIFAYSKMPVSGSNQKLNLS